MSNEEIKMDIQDSDGRNHCCKLVSKVNNGNGQMIFVFREEGISSDFTISKHGDQWSYVRGDLPYEGCIADIGSQLDERNV